MKSKILLICCVILCVENSLQFEICSDIIPQHNLNQVQVGRAPISINVQTGILARSTIEVTIRGNQNFQFRGFEIQARTQSGEIVGTFQSNNEVNIIECDGKVGSAATQSNFNPKSEVQISWEAPDVNENLIFNFVVTIIESNEIFWIGQQSSLNLILPNEDLTNAETQVTDDIWMQNEIENIYEGCGVAKTCFGIPNWCFRERNCDTLMAVTYNDTNDLFYFEFLSPQFTNNRNYVSGGMSLTPSMGGTSVVECVQFNPGEVLAYISWTMGTQTSQRSQVEQEYISLIHGSIINGRIYCKVERAASGVVNGLGTVFDLKSQEFYMLIAVGSNAFLHSVVYHNIDEAVSDIPVLLTEANEVIALENVNSPFLLIHGSFMIVAWIGLTSIGIVTARYFKPSWQDKKALGKDIWFVWHVTCMGLTFVLTLAGFIIIFIDIGEWRTTVHAVTGTVAFSLMLIQAVGAIFRPDPKAVSRPLFNWIHKAFGNITHLLAVITIFYAVALPSAALPQYTMYVLAAFAAFYLFMHIIFNSIDICGKMETGKSLGVGESKNSPFDILQKTLYGFFVIVISIFVIGLLLIFILDLPE